MIVIHKNCTITGNMAIDVIREFKNVVKNSDPTRAQKIHSTSRVIPKEYHKLFVTFLQLNNVEFKFE